MRLALTLIVAMLVAYQSWGAAITGTPEAVVLDTGANPASDTVTVPADAEICYVAVVAFTSTNGAGWNGTTPATLGGNAASVLPPFEVPSNTTAGGEPWAGIAGWLNPPTGTQTLDLNFDAATGDGPTAIFFCVNDAADGALYRDVDGANGEAAAAQSVTLTTASGDLVLKFDGIFSGTPPGTSASWTSVQTQTANNSYSSRLSSIVASGATQACDAENESYTGLICISIEDQAAGGGVVDMLTLQNLGKGFGPHKSQELGGHLEGQ